MTLTSDPHHSPPPIFPVYTYPLYSDTLILPNRLWSYFCCCLSWGLRHVRLHSFWNINQIFAAKLKMLSSVIAVLSSVITATAVTLHCHCTAKLSDPTVTAAPFHSSSHLWGSVVSAPSTPNPCHARNVVGQPQGILSMPALPVVLELSSPLTPPPCFAKNCA